jgi:hypothetical protein
VIDSGRSVLVGFADALSAPEAAASLLRAGHRVIGFARRGRPTTLERMVGVEIVPVTAPENDLEQCAAEVAGAAEGADVTMPLDDTAVLLCELGLPDEALVAGPRGARARFALDKRLQLRAAAAAGMAVPEWIELTSDAPPIHGVQLPAIAKPALAAEQLGGRLRRLSPRIVATNAELERIRRAWGESSPALLQRLVGGTGAGVFGLADEHGLHHLSAHRRVRMMNPAGSGSSACASEPVPGHLTAPIRMFLERADWDGMFMIELLRGAEGEWWFMELNGRPWGSLALARRLGFEYPAWAVARTLDPSAPLPEAPPYFELLCRHLGRELIHLLFVIRGSDHAHAEWAGRLATMRALLRRESPTAWYNRAPEMRGVFLYDAWRTVVDQTWGKRRR